MMLKLFTFIKFKLKVFSSLIKSLQTGLLVFTAFTGFISVHCPVMNWEIIIGLLGSIFLAVSGSTVLNMVYDCDIDEKMNRTSLRPLPTSMISIRKALILGLVLSLLGLLWAFLLSFLFGVIVFAGLFIDVIVYTIWWKRRTAWSIVWGGVSGGMPILAGRVLGTGEIDLIGIILALAIVLWIPTHMLTFSMRYYEDYNRAGIPTFPSTYGYKYTRLIVALSSIGAAVSIGMIAIILGLSGGYIRLFVVLSIGFVGLSIFSISRPSEKLNLGLFKYASFYMLGSMLLLVLGAFE